MKRLFAVFALVLSFCLVSSPALAFDFNEGASKSISFSKDVSFSKSHWLKKMMFHFKMKMHKCHDKPARPSKSVPEIDTAHAGLAVALLAGIFGISRERRRRKQ